MRIPRSAMLCLLCVPWCFPSGVQAQTVHGEETESIEPPAVAESPNAARPDLAQVEALIVQLVNEFRRSEGRTEVKANDQLTAAAHYFAGYLAQHDKFGHTADGQTPVERARKHGYAYCIVDENIACQFNSAGFQARELASDFVTSWKKSPGHRRNMLDADVTETGVGVAHSRKTGYYYAVQMFGRPASQRIEFRIGNQAETTVEYQVGERTFSLPPRYTRTHQLCRTGELTFHLPGTGGEGTNAKTETFKPVNGSRYVIEQGPEGGLRVKNENSR